MIGLMGHAVLKLPRGVQAYRLFGVSREHVFIGWGIVSLSKNEKVLIQPH